ncbi:MAG: hypothetical protein ACR2PQ_05420 [Myxococcota bacterium]
MPAHVLILGCGRSGTSIFGELFEQLEGYSYLSEPPFAEIAGLDLAAPVAIKVPTESAGHPASPGLSFPLDTMLSWLPEPRRIYWQVRHPLDAIASLRVGITDGWGHHPRPPDWRSWLDRPVIERCAHHWSHLNEVGYDSVRNLVRICRFEDLLEDPAAFAAQICEDVGADPATNTAGTSRWATRVQDTNNEKFVEARTSRRYSRPDHTRKVGRWRENLTPDELRLVLPIVRPAAERFGYALPDAAVPVF